MDICDMSIVFHSAFLFWSVSSPYFMMVCLLISLKHFRINRDTGYVVFTTLLFLIYLVLAFMGGGTFVGTVVTSLMGIVFFTDPRFLKLVFDKFVYVFRLLLCYRSSNIFWSSSSI